MTTQIMHKKNHLQVIIMDNDDGEMKQKINVDNPLLRMTNTTKKTKMKFQRNDCHHSFDDDIIE